MDLEQVRNKVKEFATLAVKHDKLEEYEKAYDFYVKAANQLQLLINLHLCYKLLKSQLHLH